MIRIYLPSTSLSGEFSNRATISRVNALLLICKKIKCIYIQSCIDLQILNVLLLIKTYFLKSNDKTLFFHTVHFNFKQSPLVSVNLEPYILLQSKTDLKTKKIFSIFIHAPVPLHAWRGDKTIPPFYHRDHWASPAEY